MMKEVSIVQKICSQWISNKTVIVLLELFIPGIVKKLSTELSERAHNNLLFRQFYFLLKNGEYQRFIQSVVYLKANQSRIFQLLQHYHYELIFRDFTDGGLLFRFEMYDILEQNLTRICNIPVNFVDGHASIYEVPLLDVYDGNEKKNIFLQIEMYDISSDCQLWISNLSFSIKTQDILIHTLRFYLWKERVFIGDLQHWKNAKDYLSLEKKYYRIGLYLLWKILNRLFIVEIMSFSNRIHPCRYHFDNGGFRWDYDNICQSLGMTETEDGYFIASIEDLNAKNINPFIQRTLDFHFDNICKKLKI